MAGGEKLLRHPRLGEMALEYSAYAVDGRPDLTMLVYQPVEAADAERIRSLARTLGGGASSPAAGGR